MSWVGSKDNNVAMPCHNIAYHTIAYIIAYFIFVSVLFELYQICGKISTNFDLNCLKSKESTRKPPQK